MQDYIVRIQLLKGATDAEGNPPDDAIEIESDILTYSNLDNALAVFRAAQEPQKAAYDAGVQESYEKVSIGAA